MDEIRPGSRVILDGGNVTGAVIRLLLNERGVEGYEVVWWVDGARYCEWVEPSEVELVESGE